MMKTRIEEGLKTMEGVHTELLKVESTLTLIRNSVPEQGAKAEDVAADYKCALELVTDQIRKLAEEMETAMMDIEQSEVE